MIFGVFLVGITLTYGLARWYWRWNLGKNWKEGRLLRITAVSVTSGLLMFVALSAGIDVMRFGQPTTYRLPQDYLAAGFLGWLAMVIGAATLLSPLLISFFVARSKN